MPFPSLESLETSRRFARRTTGCSKTELPSSRTRSICFLDDTNCEVYEVPLDLGTNDMGALHIEHKTL